MKKGLILLILLMITSSSLSQRYLLPFPVTASNGLPIRNGTFAIYDSAGSTSAADLTYLSGEKYYYTTLLTSGWYDVKQKIGSTWYTYLNNIWITTGQVGIGGSGKILIISDTTSLKNFTAGSSDTTIVYLKQFDFSDTTGGGFFLQKDSTYVEDGENVFDNSTAGKQWVRDDYLKVNNSDNQILVQTWRSDMSDSLSVYVDAITSLPFMGGADSTVITTTDTIPMGYAPAAFTVDTVIVSCYGGTPNLTLQIYHSGSTAIFTLANTINTKGVTKISTFSDGSMTKGKIFYVTPSVTTKPSKISVQLIGKKL